ncbi:hypothetical protein [Actinopolyspora alba]|uniref:hypothetical protein n=1 Tax=Actinopolyspora alba TaxID=673379 RepID=UPI0011146165|nr:hypothetical protein [Actinopolyspora alba]
MTAPHDVVVSGQPPIHLEALTRSVLNGSVGGDQRRLSRFVIEPVRGMSRGSTVQRLSGSILRMLFIFWSRSVVFRGRERACPEFSLFVDSALPVRRGENLSLVCQEVAGVSYAYILIRLSVTRRNLSQIVLRESFLTS